MADSTWLQELVREIPDYPKPGVGFKDITPLLANADAFRFSADALADHFTGASIDCVIGVEARGFITAAPVAYRLGAGFVPVRKAGKLPFETVSEEYELEYGIDQLEMHVDALAPGQNVLIIDDVLATGGTAAATARLVEGAKAKVVGFGFWIELGFLDGRAALSQPNIASLITYES